MTNPILIQATDAVFEVNSLEDALSAIGKLEVPEGDLLVITPTKISIKEWEEWRERDD